MENPEQLPTDEINLSPLPTLHTERLLLRAYEPADAADMFAYAQSPIVGPMAGWPPHKTLEDSQGIIERFIREQNVWAIVEKRSGRVMGSMGLHNDDKRELSNVRMLGYALGENYWGQGYATEASQAVLRYAFEVLALPLISVYHFPHNPKSKRVIEKLGFVYEGTLRMATLLPDGSSTDDVCYSLTQAEYVKAAGHLKAAEHRKPAEHLKAAEHLKTPQCLNVKEDH